MCNHKHAGIYLFTELRTEEGEWRVVEGEAKKLLPDLLALDRDEDVVYTVECDCGYFFETDTVVSKVALLIQNREESLCR